MGDTDHVDFAEELGAQVRRRHPSVGLDAWTSAVDDSRSLNFVPANEGGASVTVTVFTDLSVWVECGASVLRDSDYVSSGSVLDSTVALVLAYADHGYAKVRAIGLLGPLSRSVVGPAGGFFGLDDYIRAPFAEVVDVLEPWSAPPSA